MSIPYRTQRRLQNFGIFLLILLLVLAFVWFVWLIWLDRYVVYTRNGAKLDFQLSADSLSGEIASSPEAVPTVPIYFNEGDNQVDSEEPVQIYGYYADAGMLRNDMDTVIRQVKQLPPETAVMLDLKDISGRFYYSTALGVDTDPRMDIEAVDTLIALLQERNLYAIARIPAFRDRLYGLDHVPDGLYHSSRRYLWMDSSKCYWLNPTKEGTLSYLMEIVSELKALGFDEVVFDEFRFPDTDDIYFDGDRDEALENAALQLKAACATDAFAVSFFTDSAAFPLPDGNTRLYIPDMEAANLTGFASETGLEDPKTRLVFLTDSRDTRFAEYGILRPITAEIIPQAE